MSGMDLMAYTSAPNADVVARIADAYLDVFSREPYAETRADRDAFADRVERMALRDGFRLVVAWEGATAVGLGLAAVAHPGDWWRDRVAKCLDPGEVGEWLGSACLEVVHLAVRPSHRGRGIGCAIHDALLVRGSAPTAVLTVLPAATAARRLYARAGWIVLRDAVTVGVSRGVVLMGRRLEKARDDA